MLSTRGDFNHNKSVTRTSYADLLFFSNPREHKNTFEVTRIRNLVTVKWTQTLFPSHLHAIFELENRRNLPRNHSTHTQQTSAFGKCLGVSTIKTVCLWKSVPLDPPPSKHVLFHTASPVLVTNPIDCVRSRFGVSRFLKSKIINSRTRESFSLGQAAS